MNYLARLKQLQNSENTLGISSDEPPKPPKAPFDPFAGSNLGGDKNISAIIDKTPERKQDLERLVLLVSKRCGFSKEDYEEALHHALNNPVNAIACFMELERQTNQITSVEVKI